MIRPDCTSWNNHNVDQTKFPKNYIWGGGGGGGGGGEGALFVRAVLGGNVAVL